MEFLKKGIQLDFDKNKPSTAFKNDQFSLTELLYNASTETTKAAEIRSNVWRETVSCFELFPIIQTLNLSDWPKDEIQL